MATFWITKFALTEGIRSLDGAEVSKDGYLTKDGRTFGSWDERRHFYAKSDYHATRDLAVARAEQMRAAKIASLNKQIAKLEALRFQT